MCPYKWSSDQWIELLKVELSQSQVCKLGFLFVYMWKLVLIIEVLIELEWGLQVTIISILVICSHIWAINT
jgi:hypothetical protein